MKRVLKLINIWGDPFCVFLFASRQQLCCNFLLLKTLSCNHSCRGQYSHLCGLGSSRSKAKGGVNFTLQAKHMTLYRNNGPLLCLHWTDFSLFISFKVFNESVYQQLKRLTIKQIPFLKGNWTCLFLISQSRTDKHTTRHYWTYLRAVSPRPLHEAGLSVELTSTLTL